MVFIQVVILRIIVLHIINGPTIEAIIPMRIVAMALVILTDIGVYILVMFTVARAITHITEVTDPIIVVIMVRIIIEITIENTIGPNISQETQDITGNTINNNVYYTSPYKSLY